MNGSEESPSRSLGTLFCPSSPNKIRPSLFWYTALPKSGSSNTLRRSERYWSGVVSRPHCLSTKTRFARCATSDGSFGRSFCPRNTSPRISAFTPVTADRNGAFATWSSIFLISSSVGTRSGSRNSRISLFGSSCMHSALTAYGRFRCDLLDDADLAVVAQYQLVRLRLVQRARDLDVAADQAVLDARADVHDAAVLEHDAVLDLGVAHGAVMVD